MCAAINPLGAQLSSLQLDGREYLWQGNPEFWPRRAPVLFPIVGSLRSGRATSMQGPCVMGRHGIARNYEHKVADQAADGSSVAFELRDNDETLAAYPYHFKLNMTYALTGEATLSQTFRVTNTGEAELPFCVGGHPAFNVPLPAGKASDPADETTDNEAESFEDYKVKFTRPWSCRVPVIGNNGLMSWEDAYECPVASDTVALSHGLFDHDALMFTDAPDSTLTLLGTRSGHGGRVEFPDFRYIGVGSAAGASPFVALEPWTGHTTARDEDNVFEHKAGMTILQPGETDKRTFHITLF